MQDNFYFFLIPVQTVVIILSELGFWKNKGFERIADLKTEVKEASKQLETSILRREFFRKEYYNENHTYT
ncbi:MAG: hypothetical protein GY795_13630 [Desulfobacterales bacterium]|nr:hypothetical protein [Desulfobacterales bacterium]